MAHVPADGAFVVVAPGVQRLSDAISGMVRSVGPAEMVGQFDLLHTLREGLPLGEGLDATGSFAAVLLDPRKADKAYVQKIKDDEFFEIEDPADILQELPIIYIAPVTDAKKLFNKEILVVEKDGLLEWRADEDKDAELYGKVVGKHVAMALKKPVLAAWSSRVNLMTRLTPAQEQDLTRQQVWFWADRKLLGQLRKEKLLPIEFLDDGPSPFVMMGMPPLAGLIYAHQTRDEIFDEATTLSGGMEITDKAILLDARWTYPAGAEVRKTLAEWKQPDKPLINKLPSLDAAWLYGADKSTFSTPLAIKKKQYEKLLNEEDGIGQFLQKADRDKAINAVLGLQKQVTAVQHYAGPTGKDNPAFTFATVIGCKSSSDVLQRIREVSEVFLSITQKMGGPQVLWKSKVAEIDQLPVHEINLSFGQQAGGEVGMMLNNILGDTKARLLVVAVDEKTVITTAGGNIEFLKQMVELLQSDKQTPLNDQAREIARLLPKNRTAEMYVDIRNTMSLANAIYGKMGNPMVVPEWTGKTPIAAALAIEPDAIRIAGAIPLSTIKGYFDMVQSMMGVGYEELPAEVEVEAEVEIQIE
ncbi:MAG: hypothetical protein ACLFUJ_12730 [Phycisphaerae bacterium]